MLFRPERDVRDADKRIRLLAGESIVSFCPRRGRHVMISCRIKALVFGKKCLLIWLRATRKPIIESGA